MSEPTELLGANQVSVEQRYFLPSRPRPARWKHLTIRQAAADHHRIVSALEPICGQRWIFTRRQQGWDDVGLPPPFLPQGRRQDCGVRRAQRRARPGRPVPGGHRPCRPRSVASRCRSKARCSRPPSRSGRTTAATCATPSRGHVPPTAASSTSSPVSATGPSTPTRGYGRTRRTTTRLPTNSGHRRRLLTHRTWRACSSIREPSHLVRRCRDGCGRWSSGQRRCGGSTGGSGSTGDEVSRRRPMPRRPR